MKVLAAALAALAAQEIGAVRRKVRVDLVAYAIAAFLLLTAYIIGLAGAVFYLATAFGSIQIVVVFATIFASMALVLLIALHVVHRIERQRAIERNARTAALAQLVLDEFGAVLRHPKTATAVVAVALVLLAGLAGKPGDRE